MKTKLTVYSRIIVAVCGLLMVGSLFMSVWQIRLEAPQYPEGLKMEIWANKLAGDVDKINGLNHYIGMAHISEEHFPEFKVMPWLIVAMIALSLIVAITGRRWLLWLNATYLVLCGIWGSYDFWRWEYEYGHNLDPHAAIKIPGMAYQPPLFGWKQLLNFTAGSFPDVGGWLIILPAAVIVGVLMFEIIGKRKIRKAMIGEHGHSAQNHIRQTASAAVVLGMLMFTSCNSQPEPIIYGKDQCQHCKMMIMDNHFGAELMNSKGKTYKFDSGECMLAYLNQQNKQSFTKFLVTDYSHPEKLIDATKATFLQGGSINSPMGGKLAAFSDKEAAAQANKEFAAEFILWPKLLDSEPR